jgi:6-pyruvoyltetrahydropterin/6-carboxytetrahydropterin synthase
LVRITRAIDFSTSLRIRRPDLSEPENRRVYGRRADRHGHNYRLEVTLRGRPDPDTGMLVDLKEVKEVLEREIVARFDHRDLNDDTPYFEKEPATLENFGVLVHRLLEQAFPPGLLHGIRLRESEESWVDVTGEESAP